MEKLWIPGRPDSGDNLTEAFDSSASSAVGGDQQFVMQREESATSTVSLGDTHVWRDDGDENV